MSGNGVTGRGPALPVSLDAMVAIALVALVVTSTARYLANHPWDNRAAAILCGAGLLIAAQAMMLRARAGSPQRRVLASAAALLCGALVLAAPSFAWCAVPVAFGVLSSLPPTAAVVVVLSLGAAVSISWTALTGRVDPTLIVGPLALVLITVAAVRTLQDHIRARDRALSQLVEAQADLSAEQRRTGALSERNRVARDLHDSVGQTLTSVGLILSAADRELDQDLERARGRVREANEATRTALGEVRSVIADLAAPTHANGERLIADLERQLRALPRPVQGRLNVHGELDSLPPAIVSAVLMSARGALANVREHANAQAATVTLTRLEDTLILDVRDDGIGLGHQPARALLRGHGIDGIRSRAAELGGTLTMEDDNGTILTLSLPLLAREARS